jgi:hypothetical protein
MANRLERFVQQKAEPFVPIPPGISITSITARQYQSRIKEQTDLLLAICQRQCILRQPEDIINLQLVISEEE